MTNTPTQDAACRELLPLRYMSTSGRIYDAKGRTVADVRLTAGRELSQFIVDAVNALTQQAKPVADVPIQTAAKRRQLSDVLLEHHKWHQEIGMVRLIANAESGLLEPVDLDMSLEYQDSGLRERTEAALYGTVSLTQPPSVKREEAGDVVAMLDEIYELLHSATATELPIMRAATLARKARSKITTIPQPAVTQAVGGDEVERVKKAIGTVFVPDGIWNIEEGWKLERAAKAAITALQSPPREGDGEWLPIETAQPDSYGIFYLEWADDVVHLNVPIEEFFKDIEESKWRLFFGKNKCWGSTYKATKWQPYPVLHPAPPAQSGEV